MQTPSQRRKTIQTLYPKWEPKTLSQSLDSAVKRYGNRPLVITDDKHYTYQEIQTWSRELAAGFIALGVKPGDHVALILGNFPDYVAVKYAISRVGAVAVPINYGLRRKELSYILAQSDSTVLITMDKLRDRNYVEDFDDLMPGWETLGGGAKFPLLKHLFVVSPETVVRPSAASLESLRQLGVNVSRDELIAREEAGDPNLRSDVVYTSGTTGVPKGVMLTHDMVLRAAYASAYTRAFEDGRRVLFSLPMYHVFGYVECLIACTYTGGAVVPHVIFSADHMLESAEIHQVSEMVCVPMMTLKLLELARIRGFDSSHFLAMFNSGGASPPSIWNDIREILGAKELLTGYGMSETTASTACSFPEGADELLLRTHGRLKYAGVAGDSTLGGMLAEYKCIDPFDGTDLPLGSTGELVARGPIVTRGYYKKDAETAAAFNKDGWLHTGDLGVVDAYGNISLTGRLKETYRCGGEMVMPREIEDIVNEHTLVSQALVVGIPDPKMGEIGCVCVIPKGDVLPDPKELIELCASQLARFKVPRHIIFLTADEVPLTATGRPQKFLLADLVKKRLLEEAEVAKK